MSKRRMTDEELAREAARWEKRELNPSDWEDAPEALPRAGESVAVSIRLPKQMLSMLREFARRTGIGYQVLMKRWLDDRIRSEYEVLKAKKNYALKLTRPLVCSQAAGLDPKGIGHLTEEDTLDDFGRFIKQFAPPKTA